MTLYPHQDIHFPSPNSRAEGMYIYEINILKVVLFDLLIFFNPFKILLKCFIFYRSKITPQQKLTGDIYSYFMTAVWESTVISFKNLIYELSIKLTQNFRDFPSGSVVKICLPMQGTWVPSLVREPKIPHTTGQLRPHTTTTEFIP